ncbi:MAG: hypothetical protein QXH88_07305 [Sulfolobales archaeon]
MSCDHRGEAGRLSKLLESEGLGKLRVESYGSYHIVVVELCEDFYLFVSISCSNGGYLYEFALGDENFVFGLNEVECLDRAVATVKKVATWTVPR